MSAVTVKVNEVVTGTILTQEPSSGAKEKNVQINEKSIRLQEPCNYTGPREDKCKGLIDRKGSHWFASAVRRHGAKKNDLKPVDNPPVKTTPAFNKEKAKEKFLGLIHQQTLSVTDSLKIGPMTFVSPESVSGTIRYQNGFSTYTTVDGGKISVNSQVLTGDLFLFGPEGVSKKQFKKAQFLAQALGFLELPKNPEGLRGFYQPKFQGSAK